MEKRELRGLKYLVKYPKEFCKDKKYPMIFFLHGVGSCGDTFEKLEKNPYFLNGLTDRFITYAPLCNSVSWFDLFEHLKALLEFAANEKYVDEERIYGMGASMGGYGIWQLAMSVPEYFAAIVPICGGGMYWSAYRLKNVPIWAFHGEDDEVVLCRESVKMTEAVNSCGGTAKLTVCPGVAHNSWDSVYSNESVFDWLLENKRKIPLNCENKYDEKNFG